MTPQSFILFYLYVAFYCSSFSFLPIWWVWSGISLAFKFLGYWLLKRLNIFSIRLVAILVSTSGRWVLRLHFFHWVVCKVCLYSVDTITANIFSQFGSMYFYCHQRVKTKVLNFNVAECIHFYLYALCFWIFVSQILS